MQAINEIENLLRINSYSSYMSSFKAYRSSDPNYLFGLSKNGYCITLDIPFILPGLWDSHVHFLGDKSRKKIAVGLSGYDVNDSIKIMGKKSKMIKNILGYDGREEIIHKDDLVLY